MGYTHGGLADIKDQVECPKEPSTVSNTWVQSDVRLPFGREEERQLFFLNCQRGQTLRICLHSDSQTSWTVF